MRDDTEEVSEYIAEWIRGRNDGGKGESFQTIADFLGVAKTTVQHVADGQRSAGPKVERLFAKKLFSGSVDTLRKAAASASASRARKRVAGEDLPESLRAAIEMERTQREVPDEVVEILRSMARCGNLLKRTWLSILDDLLVERAQAASASSSGSRKRSAL